MTLDIASGEQHAVKLNDDGRPIPAVLQSPHNVFARQQSKYVK